MIDLVYPLRREADWFGWGGNFTSVLVANPAPFGMNASSANQIEDVYNQFAFAYTAAIHPSTRTRLTIEAKDSRLKDFKVAVRPIVGEIQARAATTNQQRMQLGLRVRDVTPTPAPVPAWAPEVAALLTGPQSIRVRASDPLDPNRRAKPAGVRQVLVYVAMGGTTLPDPKAWRVWTMSGRTTVDLVFDDMAQPTTVWVRCGWANTRNVTSPLSPPVSVLVPGIAPTSAAATTASDEAMKIAA